jgi:intein-encoded DNA endonuclease-like protein
MELKYKGKYDENIVLNVLELLNKNLQIREIAKLTRVPETTIRNWKLGYTDLYGRNNKLDDKLKEKVLGLLDLKLPPHIISRKLNVNYNDVRLFLRKELSEKEYSFIKASDRKLRDESKTLTPELSYVLGVLYGDGYFNSGEKSYQISLGAKDKDFVDYFAELITIWSGKKPSRSTITKNNKPYYECYLCFKDAASFVRELVGGRNEIPKIIFDTDDKEIYSMFVKGFCDSEGTFFTNKYSGTLKMSNQKKNVLNQVMTLMIRLGFNPEKLKIVFSKVSVNGDVFVLKIHYRDQLRLFYEKIGFTIQRKQRKLENCLKIEKL